MRDTESDGDISDWDPEADLSFFDVGSAIFPVVPGVDGPVRCEVWQGTPKHLLPRQFLRQEFDIGGALRVEDPAGVVTIELRSARGRWMISVLGEWEHVAHFGGVYDWLRSAVDDFIGHE